MIKGHEELSVVDEAENAEAIALVHVGELLKDVSTVYAGLELGFKPSRFTGRGRESRRRVSGAEAQDLSGQDFLEMNSDLYDPKVVKTYARDMADQQKLQRLTAVAASVVVGMGVAVFTSLGGGAEPSNETSEIAAIEDEHVEVLAQDERSSFVTTGVTPTTTEATTSTTSTTPSTTSPETTTSTVAPTTSAPAPPTTSAPQPAFDYSTVQVRKSLTVDKALSLVAKDLGQSTGDFDSEDNEQIYRYADMLVAYNGLQSADDVKYGEQIAYNDCKSNAKIVLPGDSLFSIAKNIGKTEDEVRDMNGGVAARAILGTCVRVK